MPRVPRQRCTIVWGEVQSVQAQSTLPRYCGMVSMMAHTRCYSCKHSRRVMTRYCDLVVQHAKDFHFLGFRVTQNERSCNICTEPSCRPRTAPHPQLPPRLPSIKIDKHPCTGSAETTFSILSFGCGRNPPDHTDPLRFAQSQSCAVEQSSPVENSNRS
jgi:hypothetical protein